MLVLSWEREREKSYMCFSCVGNPPKGKYEADTRMVEFYHLDGCGKTRSRRPSLLSTPSVGVDPYYKLRRIRDSVRFVHHYIPSIQHITCPTGGTQLIVVKWMNELRMANQSLLIAFLVSQKTPKTLSTFTGPSPHSSRPSGLREGWVGKSSPPS